MSTTPERPTIGGLVQGMGRAAAAAEGFETAMADLTARLAAMAQVDDVCTLEKVQEAYRAIAALPPRPKCVAVAPDVLDGLKRTVRESQPADFQMAGSLGLPLFVDEDLPPGTVELRNEFPPPKEAS